jgi:hypothetical protein
MSKKPEPETQTNPQKNNPSPNPTPAAPQTTEPETTPKKVAPPPPAALPAQAPTTQKTPAYATTVVGTEGTISNPNNIPGSETDEKYTTIGGGGKIMLMQNQIIAAESPIVIHARGGGPNCNLYVYIGTAPEGPWTLLAMHVINRSNWAGYISNTPISGQYIALVVTGDHCIDINSVYGLPTLNGNQTTT